MKDGRVRSPRKQYQKLLDVLRPKVEETDTDLRQLITQVNSASPADKGSGTNLREKSPRRRYQKLTDQLNQKPEDRMSWHPKHTGDPEQHIPADVRKGRSPLKKYKKLIAELQQKDAQLESYKKQPIPLDGLFQNLYSIFGIEPKNLPGYQQRGGALSDYVLECRGGSVESTEREPAMEQYSCCRKHDSCAMARQQVPGPYLLGDLQGCDSHTPYSNLQGVGIMGKDSTPHFIQMNSVQTGDHSGSIPLHSLPTEKTALEDLDVSGTTDWGGLDVDRSSSALSGLGCSFSMIPDSVPAVHHHAGHEYRGPSGQRCSQCNPTPVQMVSTHADGHQGFVQTHSIPMAPKEKRFPVPGPNSVYLQSSQRYAQYLGHPGPGMTWNSNPAAHYPQPIPMIHTQIQDGHQRFVQSYPTSLPPKMYPVPAAELPALSCEQNYPPFGGWPSYPPPAGKMVQYVVGNGPWVQQVPAQDICLWYPLAPNMSNPGPNPGAEASSFIMDSQQEHPYAYESDDNC